MCVSVSTDSEAHLKAYFGRSAPTFLDQLNEQLPEDLTAGPVFNKQKVATSLSYNTSIYTAAK